VTGLTALQCDETAFYRAIVESSGDCIKVVSLDGRLLASSDNAKQILCIEDFSPFIGQSWIDFWNGQDREAAQAAVAAAAAGRQGRFTGYFPVAGHARWWDVALTPIRNAAREVVQVLAVSRDITAQKQAQLASQWLVSTVESSDDAIMAADLTDTIVSWNRGAERMFGYSAAEAVGRSLSIIRVDEGSGSEPRIIELLQAGRRVDHFEARRRTRDGRELDVSISASPVKDPAGKVVGVAKIIRDISDRKRTEEALRRGEAQINAMIDQAPIGIFVVDAQLRLVRVNAKAMPAFSGSGVLGRDFSEVMHAMWPAATARQVVRDFRETLETGEPHFYRGWSDTREDRAVREHYDWEIHRLTYPDGQHGVACYFFDLAPHVIAQRKLSDLAGQFDLAVQATKLGLWRWDAATDLVDFSPRAAEVFGIPPGPFMTWTKMQELLVEGDGERAGRAVEQSIATRTDYMTEYRVNRPAGGQVWVAASGRPVFSGDKVVAMLGFVQDITDRKNTEAERTMLLLEEQKAREEAEALSEAARALTADLDLQATVQKATDVATRMTGAKFGAFFYNVVNELQESYTLYTLSGAPREAFSRFGLPRNTAVFGPTFRGEGVVRLADVTADPRYGRNSPHHGMPKGHLPVRSYLAVPVISRTGEVLGGMFFGHPDPGVFTERAERIGVGIAAQASIAMDNAKLYRTLQSTVDRLNFSMASLSLGHWVWDAVSDKLNLSERAADIYGVKPQPMTREEIRQAIHPEDRDRARQMAAASVEQRTDYDIEYRVLHPVRGLCWVAARGRPVFNDEGRVASMIGVVQDITERKTAELHLRYQRDVLERIVQADSLPAVLDSLARWVEGSIHRRAMATILLISPRGESLLSAAGPSCPESWSKYVNGIPVGDGIGSCGTAAFLKQRVVVSDVATDPRWAAFRDEALKHNLRACWSTPILATDGRVLGTFAIYYPEPGEPAKSELEIVDVVTRTAAIAIERKLVEEELRESRARLEQHAEVLESRVAERTAKLRETIGELEAFSYSVSHDMRAPLRAMQGYSDRLLKLHAHRLDDESRGYLDRINRNAQRLELLVRDVLAYSKVSQSEIELVPLDLDAFVLAVASNVPEGHRDDVKMVVRRPLPLVLGHEAYLSQIFTNLLGNAVKFAAPDRAPEITISAEPQGRHVAVSVRDNGIGIAPEHFERIFQIFGRVYPDKKYEGTGIGLAIVKKAVQRMGGTITVESQLGQGSCFTFTLQRA
jgi:PAS domain S-box-containing protein